jgi:hypothetical protein
MAEAHGMIGAAEELLWPGRRPQAQVAIMAPRSALPWDALDTKGAPIRDAGNPRIDGNTVDYMSEAYCLYMALQHANIPCDWVEEDDLSVQGLAGYRVLFLTAPDVPAENQRGLTEWVQAGGTLATVSGAATGDRYHEPCTVLSDFTGIQEAPRERLLVEKTQGLPVVAEGTGACGAFRAVGVHGELRAGEYGVKASFTNGAPAVVEQSRGKGRVVHFAWMPGMSYLNTVQGAPNGLPVGFSVSVRDWITYPVEASGAEPSVAVDIPMIETPVLLSEKGAAVTLLNWTGEKQTQVKMTLRLPFEIGRAKAVKAGELTLRRVERGVVLDMPLGAADIVMCWPTGEGR